MKKVLVITLAAALVLALGSCSKKESAGAASSTAEVVRFRFNGTVPEEHIMTKQTRKAAALLEERSNGRLIMQVFTNNTLTDSRGAYEAMQNNTIQMGDMSSAVLSGFTNVFQPFSLPFLFASPEQSNNYCRSDFFLNTLGDQVAKETGVRPVGAFYNGPRSISNSKREIKTPDDVKGLKIRVMESPVYIKIWETLGAQPTPMSFAELFTGLQQKTIDAQDNGPTITVTNKLYEVQKYYSTLYYVYDFSPILISEEFYKSLPDDLRKILIDTWREIIVEQQELAAEAIEAELKVMEDAGVTVTRLTDAQRMVFRQAVSPVYDWFKGQYPQLDLDAYIAAIK